MEEGSLPWYREDECESLASGSLIVRVRGTYCAINTHTLRERQASQRTGWTDVGEYHMHKELYGPPYWVGNPHPLFMMLLPLVDHRSHHTDGSGVDRHTVWRPGLSPLHSTSGNDTAFMISHLFAHEGEDRIMYPGT